MGSLGVPYVELYGMAFEVSKISKHWTSSGLGWLGMKPSSTGVLIWTN